MSQMLSAVNVQYHEQRSKFMLVESVCNTHISVWKANGTADITQTGYSKVK